MVQKNKTTKTSKASPKSNSKPKPKTSTSASTTTTQVDSPQDVNYKDTCESLIELNEALVKEIDNLMQSNITAAQIGKILGDIISSFNKQTANIKEQL